MLAPLLAALEFRCNNSAYRPVTDAIDLLDILKDTAFITDFTGSFASVASREVLDRATLNRR